MGVGCDSESYVAKQLCRQSDGCRLCKSKHISRRAVCRTEPKSTFSTGRRRKQHSTYWITFTKKRPGIYYARLDCSWSCLGLDYQYSVDHPLSRHEKNGKCRGKKKGG